MRLGTQQRPFSSAKATDVARSLLQEHFIDPNSSGSQTLWYWRESFYLYEDGEWKKKTAGEIFRSVQRVLTKCYFVGTDKNGDEYLERMEVDLRFVENVVSFLRAECEIRDIYGGGLSLNRELRELNRNWTIAFRDGVVTVEGGVIDIRTRTPDWFDTCVIPVDHVTDWAELCPQWLATVRQWSKGDPKWVTLLQRWMGYCMLPNRTFARWMLMKGVPRSGKGTIARVIRELVGPQSFMSTNLFSLSTRFGMQGLENARVLSITEAGDLSNIQAETATQRIKEILGQDPMSIEPKRDPIIHNCFVNAAIMMQSNQTVTLPNRGKGLSDKLLILPFTESFTGHEDLALAEKLLGELQGIAMWALEGARQLAELERRPQDWFPMPDQAGAELREYLRDSTPVDRFLEARYEADPDTFISTANLWSEYLNWKMANSEQELNVSRNQFASFLMKESNWNLRRHKDRSGVRGLKGLKPRRRQDANDELD